MINNHSYVGPSRKVIVLKAINYLQQFLYKGVDGRLMHSFIRVSCSVSLILKIIMESTTDNMVVQIPSKKIVEFTVILLHRFHGKSRCVLLDDAHPRLR